MVQKYTHSFMTASIYSIIVEEHTVLCLAQVNQLAYKAGACGAATDATITAPFCSFRLHLVMPTVPPPLRHRIRPCLRAPVGRDSAIVSQIDAQIEFRP